MKFRYSFLLIFNICFIVLYAQEEKNYKVNTIAFYNLENLYDTEDDTTRNDEASPMMEMGENLREGVYKQKLANMAKVIFT